MNTFPFYGFGQSLVNFQTLCCSHIMYFSRTHTCKRRTASTLVGRVTRLCCYSGNTRTTCEEFTATGDCPPSRRTNFDRSLEVFHRRSEADNKEASAEVDLSRTVHYLRRENPELLYFNGTVKHPIWHNTPHSVHSRRLTATVVSGSCM